MSTESRPPRPSSNVVYLDDWRAPNIDDMLDRVTAEARRQDEVEGEREEPLPYDPEQLHAARHIHGPSRGEHLHRQVEQAGEESQDPGTEDPA